MDIAHVQWVCHPEGFDSPIFHKTFIAQNPAEAVIDVGCMGWFALYVNGIPASDAVMEPPVSTFYRDTEGRKLLYPLRDRFRSPRAYYCRYNIRHLLRPGENLLSFHLGNGWFNQTLRDIEGRFAFGAPRLAFCLTLLDAAGNETHITGDHGVKAGKSHILQNNLFFGETHDLSQKADFHNPGYDDGSFLDAMPVPAPEVPLSLSTWPKERVIRTIEPVLLGSFHGKQLYDLGENISGRVVLDIPEGTVGALCIRHSEEITPDMALAPDSAGGKAQVQTFQVLCDGRAHRQVHPEFSWQGFRYFTLEGAACRVQCQVLHTELTQTGFFACDDPCINGLLDMYIRTQLTNLHGCVPSDCPHRERLGYTGDGQVTCQTMMHVFDGRQVYRKWMQDIVDCQNIENGHIQHTAPFFGGGGGPGGWGGAVIVVPVSYYEIYGDPSLIFAHLDAMTHYLAYMESRCEQGLVTREEPDGWCLGDWCYTGCSGIVKAPIAEAFVNTVFLIRFYRDMLRLDETLGLGLNREDYEKKLACHREAVVRSYYDPATGDFCRNHFAANAFALDVGLGDQRTLENLVTKYREFGGFDTGIFGTEALIRVLTDRGCPELVYRLLSSRKEAHSFGYMLGRGATTLWENWTGAGSHNHPMFGGCVKALWTAFLGIRPAAPGYASVTIEPCDIPELGNFHGSLVTPQGEIALTLTRSGERIQICLTLPEGIHGRFRFRDTQCALKPGQMTFTFPQ